MAAKGKHFFFFVFVAGIHCDFAKGQDTVQVTGETRTSCRTCTPQQDTLLCPESCPSSHFPAAEMISMRQCDEIAVEVATQPEPLMTRSESTSSSGPSRETFVTTGDPVKHIVQNATTLYKVTCLPCDPACRGCTGHGPANCTACADEYVKDQTSEGKCVRKTDEKGKAKSIRVPLIVGSSVGGAVFLLTILLIVCVCRCIRRRKQNLESETSPERPIEDAKERTTGKKEQTTVHGSHPHTGRPLSVVWWRNRFNRQSNPYHKHPTAKKARRSTFPDEGRTAGEIPEAASVHVYENDAFEPPDLQNLHQREASGLQNTEQQNEMGDEYSVIGCVESMQENSESVDSTSNGIGDEDLYQNISPTVKFHGASRGPDDRQIRGNAVSRIYQNVEELTAGNNTVNTLDSGYGTLKTGQEIESEHKKHQQLINSHTKSDRQYETVHPMKFGKPMFSQDWQFSEKFASTGGWLGGGRSDVWLQVPEGTITEGSQVTIKRAVSTRLDEIENKLNRKLQKDEYIASPVVEYDAGPKFVSKKPMCIVLPHFLNSLNVSVNVYRVRRKKGRGYVLQTLKQVGRDELNEESAQASIASTGVYYFGDKGRIHILTCHFSGYFCTHCGENFTSPELHLEVHAKYCSERKRPVAEVRLDIWDSRFNIQDFRQNRPEQDSFHFKGMRQMDVKTLPALSQDENLSLIELGVRLELEEGDTIWEHKRKYPSQRTIEMKQLVPCNCRPRFPHRVDWHLTTKSDGARGQVECSVDVGYVRISADARSSQLPFDYLSRPKYVTIDVCVGPESKESGAAPGHVARVAERAPSASPRQEVQRHNLSALPVPQRASTEAGLVAEDRQIQYCTPSRENQPAPSPSLHHVNIGTVQYLDIRGDSVGWNPHAQQTQFAPDGAPGTDPRRASLGNQEPLYMNVREYRAPVPASDDNPQREV